MQVFTPYFWGKRNAQTDKNISHLFLLSFLSC